MKVLRTTAEIIDALDGISNLARKLGIGVSRVGNWKYRGRFPAEQYLVLSALMRHAKIQADDSLWNFEQPSEELQQSMHDGVEP